MPKKVIRKKRIAKRKPVAKALSAEEATLLSNIKSMVSELESIGAGEAEMAEDDSVDINVIPGEEDEEFAMKARDDGPSGRDKADERLEETDEESDKNIKAVKALLRRMDSTIQKSKGSSKNLITAITGLTTVVKSLADRVDQQETAMVNVLNGIGLGNEIEKSIAPVKPVVQATDAQAVLKSLLNLTQETKIETEEVGNSLNQVRKDLGDRKVLTALLGQ